MAAKEGWYLPLGSLLNDVQVFGSADAAIAAQRLYRATIDLEDGTVAASMKVDTLAEHYRRLVQRDLGIVETELPPWGAEYDDKWEQRGRP